jgi:hypothetical protein
MVEDIVFVWKMSFWLVQNPSEERFPASGNDNRINIVFTKSKL